MPGMTASGLPAAMTVQRGDNLDLVAPAGGLIPGELVAVAGLSGVVNVGGAEGTLCGVSVKGVYAVENSGITPAAGALVAFELTNQNAPLKYWHSPGRIPNRQPVGSINGCCSLKCVPTWKRCLVWTISRRPGRGAHNVIWHTLCGIF